MNSSFSNIRVFPASTAMTFALAHVQGYRDGNGKLLGVLTSQFTLLDISRFLAELPLGAHGQAFVIDRQGYLVAAASWLLELFPEARIYGIEPDYRRVRVASRALGRKGVIKVGAAPDLPDVPEKADTAMILDVIHMLSDEDLRLTLIGLREKLREEGRLVLRATLSADIKSGPGAAQQKHIIFKRLIEVTRIRIFKGICDFRTEQHLREILDEAGFEVTMMEQSAPGHEEFWFISRVKSASINKAQG